MPPGQHRPEQRDEERRKGGVHPEPHRVAKDRSQQHAEHGPRYPREIDVRAGGDQRSPVRAAWCAVSQGQGKALIDHELPKEGASEPAAKEGIGPPQCPWRDNAGSEVRR